MHCTVVVGRFSAKHPGFAPRHGLLYNSTYYIGVHGPGHKLGIQCGAGLVTGVSTPQAPLARAAAAHRVPL